MKNLIRKAGRGGGWLYEQYLAGRQFNLEGVLVNGTAHIQMITEECFSDFFPDICPCWYLFMPSLSQELNRRLREEALSALKACDFKSGAFHIELKTDGDNIYIIDISNRMAADFPKYFEAITGIDPV